jgi:hypothetical protein
LERIYDKKGKGAIHLIRQVYIKFSDCFIENLGIRRPTKRFFQSFVKNNGYLHVAVIENRFPADAKVVEIWRNFARAETYVAIESKEYPLVNLPIEAHPILANLDLKPEKVQFT